MEKHILLVVFVGDMLMKHSGVKSPADEKPITKKQAKELIKCANDVEYFIRNYVNIQHPTLGAMLFNLRDYQKEVISSLATHDRVILNFARQLGKTTTIVAYLLHQAIFKPDITIGVCAHKGSGAKEILARIRYAYTELPLWIKPAVTSFNVFDIAFTNNSKIMSQTTTEGTYRGMSLSILYADEFAHVKPNIVEEWWKSILPTLSAKGTKFIISSTPNGSENKFADIYFKAERGENGYKSITVTNEDFPEERGEDFKKEMLKSMSPLEYSQEFLCQFVSSSSGTLIYPTVLESLRPSDPLSEPLNIRLYSAIKNKRIGLSIDVGTGTGQDHSVIQLFDLDTFEQVGEFNNNTLNLTDFTKHIIKTLQYVDKQGAKEIFYTIEANSIGQGVIQLINNSELPILKKAEFISGTGKQLGIMTTTKSKMKGCTKFKDLIEGGGMKIHSKRLISELKFFVKKGVSFAAESGKNDDLVMGCVIFCLMVDEIGKYDEDVYDKLNDSSVIGGSLEDDDEYDPMPFVF
jgi:Straboviridae terminase, large subunit